MEEFLAIVEQDPQTSGHVLNVDTGLGLAYVARDVVGVKLARRVGALGAQEAERLSVKLIALATIDRRPARDGG